MEMILKPSKARLEYYRKQRLRKLKFKFDLLKTYSDKLEFWDIHLADAQGFVSFQRSYYVLDIDKNEKEHKKPENIITIFPKDKTETEQLNRWLLNKHLRPDYYNIKKLKEKYFTTVQGNDFALEYTEQEIAKIGKRKNGEKNFINENMNAAIDLKEWDWGYQSVIENKDICLELDTKIFLDNVLGIAKGIADAYYWKFLK